jgi:predicted ATPase with chaperone activity
MVEADIQEGLSSGFSVVGLPDSAVRESRERVPIGHRVNSGLEFHPGASP